MRKSATSGRVPGCECTNVGALYPGGEDRRTLREGQNSFGIDVRRGGVTSVQSRAGDEDLQASG